jgi:hypothetical protein
MFSTSTKDFPTNEDVRLRLKRLKSAEGFPSPADRRVSQEFVVTARAFYITLYE